MTALAISDSAYIAINGQGDITLEELIESNGGKMPPPHKLTHVTIPGGGGLSWEIPGVGDEPEIVRDFVGVVLHVQPGRVKYKSAFGQGPKEAPVCKSDDGIIGVGQPGGECASCPLAQWVDGKKPECPEHADVYVLRPLSLIPVVVRLPASSLKVLADYRTGLFNATKPVYGVETKFSLIRREAGGNKFSVVSLSKTDTAIPAADRATFREMGKQIANYFVAQRSEE